MTTWQEQVMELAAGLDPLRLARGVPPEDFQGRESAVLIALVEGEDGLEVLLIERAHDGSPHSGQPALPGGAVEEQDVDLVATALREAHEETGLEPAAVTVLAVLPRLHLAFSGYAVTPVVAHWHSPGPVWARDPAEVAAVLQVPLRELLNPGNRIMVRHPGGGRGPAFRVRGLVVWGFTAALLSGLFEALGWDEPWDTDTVIALADA